ncbi:MAG TPA: cyanophycinase [Rhodothermales bacterium]|nr:cyanophycinase [Rhodothermales bacterium]
MASRKSKSPRGHGCLFAIGGAEDPDEDHLLILPHLVEMAGGKRARIVLCGAPSEDPFDKMNTYGPLFEKIGVKEIIEAPITERHDCEDPKLLEGLERATAVFITGGDQLRLTSLVAGTTFFNRVRDRMLHEKLIVAGTSAGAAAMGSTMLVAGRDGGTVRREDVRVAPGLGYWPDAVIDTHFSQRGRVTRLLTIFAENPQVIGLGIDEDTAAALVPGKGFTVFGNGVVTVFDGRVSHSNVVDAGPERPVALTDVKLHVLPHGYGFNLRTKRPVLPKPKREEVPVMPESKEPSASALKG